MSLRERLASGGFAVTAEISPPRGASTGSITETAVMLRDWVDAVNVTDNQGAHVRLASWAGSLAVLATGLEPVMQMTCRDRNRIALQSDLLGASALGIRNVLVMTGDHPKFGDHPGARPVFDLDSVQLLWTLRAMGDRGVLLSGRRLVPRPPTWPGCAWSATGSSTAATSASRWSAGRSGAPTSRSPSTCAAAPTWPPRTWPRRSRTRWRIPRGWPWSPGCPGGTAASGGSTRRTGRRCPSGNAPPGASTSPLRTFAPARGSPMTLSAPGPTAPRP